MPTDGERLDLYLVRLGYVSSRRAARQLIERGLVCVNGRAGRKGAIVSPGDSVEVTRSDERPGIEPNPDLTVEVLFEDAAVVVINKPAPMPSHPLRPTERDTVMNAVVARFPETRTAGDNPREGGLVHRLDNGTSGALMVAREARAFATLRDAIRSGLVIRRYEAIVAGRIVSKMILNAPIAHHPRNRRKMVAVREDEERTVRGARPAITIVEPVERVGECTLVSVIPRTGNRHQIRVHLASAGYPLAGDELYGGPRLAGLKPDRLWLHLRQVEFDSPASGRIRVEAPLSSDLAAALGKLRAHK
jgi:23S rRNA pseudouridine1911/1915/1917 synthase